MDLFLDYGEEIPVKSVGQLNRDFIRFHRRKKGETRSLNPITLTLNPPQFYSELEDKWFAVYYRNFYVTITQGNTIFGPHVAQLHIQIHAGKKVWLGTAQLRFNFFSPREAKKKLRIAISKRKYFCSEKSGEEIVEFTKPGDEDSLTVKI